MSDNPTPPIRLTEREMEVLKLLAEGKTTHGVAAELSIGQSTANTHMRNILEKLKLKNLKELTRYAIQNNLIEL